ncbi:MAG TPA: pantoate--beta-alanine ligase [Prolixibacteraceae bacterium]|nr:pantoate--beta-alanine ligase [Prolixibacteraceae bacterium]
MEVVRTIKDLSKIIDDQRINGSRIGFIPTMGALHQGHISLVKRAGEECNFVVVSIFVNPTQFNNKEDLERYPRDLGADVALLEKTSCNIVFAPTAEEMYPEPDTRAFNFGDIENVMEGVYRPGHFNGVAQIVSKLFDAVRPDNAYFGLKDFQQLAIIKKMVNMMNYPITIVPCAIVREADGLAMSSRNKLLSKEQRENATVISKTLFDAVNLKDSYDVESLKKWVTETINNNPYLDTEYFEIVDDTTLQPVNNWDEKVNKIGCIAVHCGKVRLIDNVMF